MSGTPLHPVTQQISCAVHVVLYDRGAPPLPPVPFPPAAAPPTPPAPGRLPPRRRRRRPAPAGRSPGAAARAVCRGCNCALGLVLITLIPVQVVVLVKVLTALQRDGLCRRRRRRTLRTRVRARSWGCSTYSPRSRPPRLPRSRGASLPPPAAAFGSTSGRPIFARCSRSTALAGKLDPIAFDGQNLDQNLITLAQLVLHFLHAMLRDFRDVQQTVGTREDFDKGAELCQPGQPCPGRSYPLRVRL